MNEQLKKLDVNGDGRVDIQDAQQVLERELAKHNPTQIFIGALGLGVIVGFVLCMLLVK